MDYISIIHQFIDPIISNPENIEICEEESKSKKDRLFVIRCSSEDMGKLIGKRGITADAIREVISIAGKNNSEHIHIKITSIENNTEIEEEKLEENKDC